MTRVLVRRLRGEARPPRRLRRRAARRARDRRRGDVDPRARPRGPALPPPLPGREVARAEAPLRPRRSARRGRRQHRQLRRGDVHRAGRDRERRRPRRRVRSRRSTSPRAHQSSYGREAAGVLAAAVAEAMRPGRDGRVGRRASRSGSRRTRRGSAIEAVADAAATLDGWRDGGLATLRAAFAPFDSVGEHYATAGPERAHPEPAARDRGGADRARPAGRDRRRLHRDDARRRQLRPRLRLDRVDGRRARRRARLAGAARAGRGGRRPRASSTSRSPAARWPRSPWRSSRSDRERVRRARARARHELAGRRRLRVTLDPAGGSRRARAPAGARGGQGRRRDRARAGSPPAASPRRRAAPRRSRRLPSCARSRSSCSTSSTRCRGRSPRRARGARRDPRRRSPAPGSSADLERIRGAWLGRAAGCVLGKPVENIPREGIRAIARGAPATGRSRGWFTAEGLDPAVVERWPVEPREPADEPGREHRRHPGGRRPQLHDARRRAARALRAATSTRSTSRRLWLDYLPPGRIFTAERVAMRNLLEAYLPPETATRRNPFREWIGARLRVDAYGWAAGGDPVARRAHGVGGRAAEPHRERRLRRDVHGGGARRLARAASSPAECAEVGLSVVPPRAGSPRRCAPRASLEGEWEARVDALYERYGHYHWVHAINNTALVAAALYAFDDFSSGDLRRRAGRLGHRHERRRRRLDLRRARPDRGALVGAAARPVRELAAGLRRDLARRARRTNARASHDDDVRPARPAADRPGRRRSTATLDVDAQDHRRARRSGRVAGVARRARAVARRARAPATTAAPTSG